MDEKRYVLATTYVHGNKETLWELGEKLGLSGDALSMFRHACDEIKIGLRVDLDTGLAEIVSVDDKAVT